MEPAQEASAGGPAAVSNNKFLTFTLGKEEYGIDILRGIIVPIVDMRIKFNLGKAEYNQFTVVIILNLASRLQPSMKRLPRPRRWLPHTGASRERRGGRGMGRVLGKAAV